jgi:nicotinate-nucleotide adenylyltransferase
MPSPAGASVLLFGGSFDPIHHGHLIVARAAAEQISAARIVLIPSALPPHKQDKRLAPAADRLEMCRRAVAGDGLFEVSDWELGQAGPNYTLLTVRHFRGLYSPEVALSWLIGMDGLIELGTWHRIADLIDACTIVTAVRPGHPAPDLAMLDGQLTDAQIAKLKSAIVETPQVEISSTQIRSRAARGLPIRYLTPEAVCGWIALRRLYTGAAPPT